MYYPQRQWENFWMSKVVPFMIEFAFRRNTGKFIHTKKKTKQLAVSQISFKILKFLTQAIEHTINEANTTQFIPATKSIQERTISYLQTTNSSTASLRSARRKSIHQQHAHSSLRLGDRTFTLAHLAWNNLSLLLTFSWHKTTCTAPQTGAWCSFLFLAGLWELTPNLNQTRNFPLSLSL